MVEDILTGGTVIGNGPNHRCQLLIIGSNGSCIAQGTKVLARVEAMSSRITKRTCLCVLR